MKNNPFLIISILLSMEVFAQETISFRDDFNDNSNNWGIRVDENRNISIKDGKYIFEVLNNWGWWMPFEKKIIGTAKTYEIEASFVKIIASGNGSLGIMLPDAKLDRYMFLINPTDKTFRIAKNIASGNTMENISNWKAHPAILGEGKSNILKIKNEEDIITFFINNKEVFKLENSPYYSNLNGFVYLQAGFEKIKMECDYLDIKYEPKVINLLPDCIKGYKKVNLGFNVNTEYIEICPLISTDGKTLYYVMRDSPENMGGKGDDVYYCEALNDSTWSMRKNIGAPINNASANGIISITPDNNYCLLMNVHNEKGEFVKNGISYATKGKDGWNIPKPLEIKNYENLHKYSEKCLAPSGSALLMTIQTKNSFGEKDIYVSFKNKATTANPSATEDIWSEPMNLGAVVNSKGDEISPFLAADGVTLYFSSDGHEGYGSADIFVTRRLDDTWTNWTVPQNLGSDINTSGWEAYYVVPASGKYAYMVSGVNRGDIIRIQLPESAKPNPILLVKGKVLNAKTKEPLEAAIVYRELKTNEEIGTAISNPATGDYSIALPRGKNYSFIADKKGFFAINDNLDATNITEYAEINRDLFLTPIEVGTTIQLNNIFFDFDKASLKDESFPELERVVTFLKDNQSIEIQINAHTDNVGSDEYNLKLSNDRAKSVLDYLVSKKTDISRLKFKGYGESKPLSLENTEEGKAQNRRVEFIVLKK